MLGLLVVLVVVGFRGKSATFSIPVGFISSVTLAIAQVGSKLHTCLISFPLLVRS